MLVNFDAPTTLVTTVRRERSNTPLQALNLLNDPVFLEAAQALAVRVVARRPTDSAERLERMFRLCLSREPERRREGPLDDFLRAAAGAASKRAEAPAKIAPFVPAGEDRLEVAAWTGLARGLMNLDEFITRE